MPVCVDTVLGGTVARQQLPQGDSAAPAPRPGILLPEETDLAALLRRDHFSSRYNTEHGPLFGGEWVSVYRCTSVATGHEYVAKFCSRYRDGVDFSCDILHEVAVMLLCRECPRIARLQEVFESEEEFVIVMEFCRGGDFQAVLDSNQVPYESNVIRYVTNVIEAVVFLHGRHIAHLDIKPQNIVLTDSFPDSEVKLCDLEVSREIVAGGSVREMLGTPDYVAPEILKFEEVTLAADIWSLGVLVYVLLTGFTPFGGDSDAETFQNISRGEVDFPEELFEDISDAAKDWITSCLVLHAGSRPSAPELLKHPWLQGPPVTSSAAPSENGSCLSIASNVCSDRRSTSSLHRAISKSREILFERAKHSQLRKCLSRSRERLCDPRLGLISSRSQSLVPAGTADRAGEPTGVRPPWRGVGAATTRGTASPVSDSATGGDRLNSFRLRDQYQSQVTASVAVASISNNNNSSGSNNNNNGCGAPPAQFVRQCSLRGRRKSNIEDREQHGGGAASSSAPNKRGSFRERGKAHQSDARCAGTGDDNKQACSSENSESAASTADRRRQSRKEFSASANDKNFIIVEIVNDEEQQDVFTRLYRESFKDPDLKMRKLRESEYNEDDSTLVRSRSSTRRARKEMSRSPESPDFVGEQFCRAPSKSGHSCKLTVPQSSALLREDSKETTDHTMASAPSAEKCTHCITPTSSSESVDGLVSRDGQLMKIRDKKKTAAVACCVSQLSNGHGSDSPPVVDLTFRPTAKMETNRRMKHQSTCTERVATADKSTATDPSLLASLLDELMHSSLQSSLAKRQNSQRRNSTSEQDEPDGEKQSAPVSVLRHIFENR